MSDFFYRQSSVSLPSGGRIRNNAYVTVKGKEFSLPIGLVGHKSTYNPNGTGRPAPILKDVSVKLEGTAGSLRRCEVAFTCFDKASFEKAEKSLLLPGSEVTISYGYSGPKKPGGSGSHKFRVYDYTFSITKENYFECNFKGVGKGGEYEQTELQVAGMFPQKTFITDYDGFNSKSKVANLFDYIDWAVQDATGKTNSTAFNVSNGTSGNLKTGDGQYGVLIAPDGFEGGIDAGFWRSDRVQYISLSAVISMINKHLLKKHTTPMEIIIDKEASRVQTKFKSGLLFAAHPFQMLIPYAKGVEENSYPDELGGTGASDDYITSDSFKNVKRFSQGTDTDPGKLLICRELLKTIQNSLSDDAIQEKAESVEKTEGLKVNVFYRKLFGAIRDNTGGAWDFYLDQDEPSIEAGVQKVKVVNRRGPATGGVSPVMFPAPSEGKNGVRELKIEAAVPKEMQAKMFGTGGGTQSETAAGVEALDGETKGTDEKPKSVAELAKDARYQIHESKYSESGINSAKATIKSLVNEFDSLEARVQAGQVKDHNDPVQMPMPLTFSATTDGLEGWMFGDTVGSSYLPARYNKNGVGKVVFTITDYEHKISNNDWTTTINAAARLR